MKPRGATLRRATIAAAALTFLLAAGPVFSAVVATSTVPTGDSPSALAVNPLTHRVYTGDYFGNSATLIDGVTETRVASVSMGRNTQIPNAVVVSALSAPPRAYLANFWSGTIGVVDEASSVLTATISLGGDHGSGAPRALALDPSGPVKKLYVAEYGASQVSVWNADTYSLIKRIPVGLRPRALGVFSSLERKRIYVLNSASNSVSVIDGATDEVVATLPVGSAPKAVAVDTLTGWAWVTNEKSNTVTAIDASDTVVGSVSVGVRPIGIAIDPATRRVLVANTASSNVSVIRSADLSREATIPVGLGPWAVAFDAADSRAFVSCYSSNTVDVIAPDLSVRSVPVGAGPYALAIDDSFSPAKVYVANRNSDTVSVLADDGLSSLFAGPQQAYAAAPPVASVAVERVAADSSAGGTVIEGTATSTRPFRADILALHVDLDAEGVWRAAEITGGQGTGRVTWRVQAPQLSSDNHTLRVRVLDQTAVATASSEGGSADKGAYVGSLAVASFRVAPALTPKQGAACARCHGTSSQGKRPNAPPSGLPRCPQAR